MVVVQGVGMAMAYAAAPMLIVEVAPADRTSEVTGVSSIVRYVFNAVGSQVVAVLLAQVDGQQCGARAGCAIRRRRRSR